MLKLVNSSLIENLMKRVGDERMCIAGDVCSLLWEAPCSGPLDPCHTTGLYPFDYFSCRCWLSVPRLVIYCNTANLTHL